MPNMATFLAKHRQVAWFLCKCKLMNIVESCLHVQLIIRGSSSAWQTWRARHVSLVICRLLWRHYDWHWLCSDLASRRPLMTAQSWGLGASSARHTHEYEARELLLLAIILCCIVHRGSTRDASQAVDALQLFWEPTVRRTAEWSHIFRIEVMKVCVSCYDNPRV